MDGGVDEGHIPCHDCHCQNDMLLHGYTKPRIYEVANERIMVSFVPMTMPIIIIIHTISSIIAIDMVGMRGATIGGHVSRLPVVNTK